MRCVDSPSVVDWRQRAKDSSIFFPVFFLSVCTRLNRNAVLRFHVCFACGPFFEVSFFDTTALVDDYAAPQIPWNGARAVWRLTFKTLPVFFCFCFLRDCPVSVRVWRQPCVRCSSRSRWPRQCSRENGSRAFADIVKNQILCLSRDLPPTHPFPTRTHFVAVSRGKRSAVAEAVWVTSPCSDVDTDCNVARGFERMRFQPNDCVMQTCSFAILNHRSRSVPGFFAVIGVSIVLNVISTLTSLNAVEDMRHCSVQMWRSAYWILFGAPLL